MHYTKQLREDMVRAFRAAHKRIAARRDGVICFALDNAAREGEADHEAAVYCARLVGARLGPCTTLGFWIREHYPHLLVGLGPEETAERLRETRLAWLDSLIKEFSK